MLDLKNDILGHVEELESRFSEHLVMNPRLNRQLVSFQASKNRPSSRWYKYKEGFSEGLVHFILDYLGLESGQLLDPFAGVGTTLLVGSERGLDSTGIELLPIGAEVTEIRWLARQHPEKIREIAEQSLQREAWRRVTPEWAFSHIKITDGAFPQTTQEDLEKFITAAEGEDSLARKVLRFAALCVLEEISYTRKDGQYLRWDFRSGRHQGAKPFDKGYIPSFEEAIQHKLHQISSDLQPSGLLPGFEMDMPSGTGSLHLLRGSALDILPTLPPDSFDSLITSPPYCNRYDYTRTYALELAMLGVDEPNIRRLRQAMLSCTVENRAKESLRAIFSPESYDRGGRIFDGQQSLQAILAHLEWQKEAKLLNNAGIPRMIRNYFFELALLIVESARLLKPGARFVMVNDNVRYGGIPIPVDLILSDFAQQAGFEIEVIWVLPTAKGNSSQQMGAHGREELRKCVYVWRRKEAVD